MLVMTVRILHIKNYKLLRIGVVMSVWYQFSISVVLVWYWCGKSVWY